LFVMGIAMAVAAVLIWEGIANGGNPIPTAATPVPMAALDVAVLVSREGLEVILVLAALVAGLKGKNFAYQRPIQVGAGLGVFGLIVTWLVGIGIVSDLAVSYGVLALQATTGMFAVIVILVEMDWFFHGVYWSGWISMQNRKKRSLIAEAGRLGKNSHKILLGLVVIGFASVYRDGFEVVIFLQTFYLQVGSLVVYYGAAAGLSLTLAIGYLTFVGQRSLPYMKMLVATGVLLTCVVFVMVGEEVNQMQLAGWIATTNIPWLQGIPPWAERWLSIFPNVQTFAAQGVALLVVAGSFAYLRFRMWRQIQRSKSVLAEDASKRTAVFG
jgi:high-affinity iron transporter